MDKRIGIIGLGRVGMPGARKFAKEGYEVVGYARRPEVVEEFTSFGGVAVNNPKEVAQRAKTVIILVLNDPQVIEVATDQNGILDGADARSRVICMSTINRENLEWVADACQEKSVVFIDCPFTGGPARVETSDLTLIVAAPSESVEAVRPELEVLGNIHHVGEKPGEGQSVKHCNQLFVGVTHAAVMETIVMAEKLGLDPRMVCNIVGNGIAGSDYFKLLSTSVLNHSPSPGGLGQMCKDVGIVANTSRNLKLPLYVATSTHQYFLAAEALKMHHMEGADLINVVRRITEYD